ncbi:hypothetical protein [Cellulomonas sp. Root137]|uniref:hypothetical protein n=1 Tax=Cellulomonas sp. Root137 TaxID=1736459 RepID=UPI0006FD4605|nr:hypothetical protein [Cellulomonas sp. Root137]KQY42952.1 hypothetical protein ASD18_18440 [Cellulomonas sp. Root137]
MSVEPVRTFTPVAPDADWEGVRVRLMAALGAGSATTWSDHNAIDPGVTLAEAAAFGLADLHYRTATRPSTWPLEVAAWEPAPDRHWHATLPPGATAVVADVLASPAPGSPARSVARVLEPLVRRCASPGDAFALLSRAPWTGTFTAAQTPVAVALLRAGLVRRLAHELTDVVADAVDAQRTTGGSVAERDARAATELAVVLPLWPDELAAVVRRERRRRSAAAMLDRLDAILAATTAPAATVVRAELATAGLSPDEVDLAMAAAPVPLGVVPEDLEETDGASRVWPPHPLQALTCEPVTDADYARRARTHPQVLRAWAVPGRLVGIGWDGRPQAIAVPTAGSVTLVVERMSRPPEVPAASWATTPVFLTDVLRTAVGTEVDQPHPTWQDTLDPLDPRRMICDEVGATLLKVCPVVLQGTLVTGVGADRASTVGGALARVAAYFAAGRPESRPAPATGPLIDGPWPRVDQPTAGWTPGEAIRFTEVVAAIVADPAILGVELLSIRAGTGPFVGSTAGSVPLDADCVPELADVQCLRVRFALSGGCSDG